MKRSRSQSEFILHSERLGFRLPVESDFEDLVKLDTDPIVRAHFPGGVLTPAQIRERFSRNRATFEENGFGDFAVIEIENGKFLAWAEQNLGVPRIIAYAPVQHSASFNVMKKCGMRYFKSDKMRDVSCDFYEYPF